MFSNPQDTGESQQIFDLKAMPFAQFQLCFEGTGQNIVPSCAERVLGPGEALCSFQLRNLARGV